MVKVSIITVCYNAETTIQCTINSVFNQTYSNIEYIVIDGKSTDGTVDVVKSFSDKITHVVSESDKGLYDAMNKGILLATGEIIGILNSDDFYKTDRVVADVVRQFNLNPKADMVLGNVDFVKPNHLSKAVRLYSSWRFSPWQMRFGFMPAHPAAFIKKTAYNQVGLYKTTYKIAADFEMFIRLLLVHRLTYTKINQVLVRMRINGISTSGLSSHWVSGIEMVRAFRENYLWTNLLLVLIRLPVKYFRSIICMKRDR